MVWFKVDDGFAFHHKAIAAGNRAIGLWTRAGAFSAAQLTDGFVPAHMLASLGGTAADAARLVDVGLWLAVDDGWQFHQWNEPGRQPTREQVEAERSAARERMRSRRTSPGVRANSEQTSEGVREPRPDPSLVPNGTTSDAKRKTPAPDLLPVTEQMREWASKNGVTVDLTAATVEMLEYHRANGSRFSDWRAAWRTWMLRTKRYGGPQVVTQQGPRKDAWRYQ